MIEEKKGKFKFICKDKLFRFFYWEVYVFGILIIYFFDIYLGLGTKFRVCFLGLRG